MSSPESATTSRDDHTETESAGKAAHPIELFFDLVYVFGFTQVVALLVYGHDLKSSLRGLLVLALLWWSWEVWTWTMNAVDLSNRSRRVVVLAAMIAIFVVGYSIPTAFSGGAMWFAAGYVCSRLLAGYVFWSGTVDDAVQHASVRSFLYSSMVAPVLLLIGAGIGGSALPWIWLAALAFEVASAVVAGQREWHIDVEHFAERHGLIMIIALGEAIIAVGVALNSAAGDDAGASWSLAWRLGIALVGVSVMWWAYFDKMQVIWERRLEEADAASAGRIAQDLYTLGHFPMLAGIVCFAVALEEAFLHPLDPLTGFTRWMLGLSVALYFLPQVAATYRAWGVIVGERVVGVIVVGVLAAVLPMRAELAVLLVTLVLIATITVEYWRFRDEVRSSAHLRR